jgi:site-specific recombinase XerD
MYEKLYVTESKLRQHLDSPLLQERMTFLLERSRAGNTNDRLRVIASYLMYAVHSLHLHDGENDYVHINELINVCRDYRTNHSKRILKSVVAIDGYRYCDVVCNIYSWLSSIGLIELKFLDEDSIFNRLYDGTVFKMKYFSAPLYDERCGHLDFLEKQGMQVRILIQYAEYHLHIIDFLKLDNERVQKGFSIDEIIAAAYSFGKLHGDRSSHGRYQQFRAVCVSWFSFIGAIIKDETSYPGSHIVEGFCKWHLEAKGSSPGTVLIIRHELKSFFEYINKQGMRIDNLSADCIDGYIKTYHIACYSRKTVSSKVSVLRTFLKHSYDTGLTKADLSSYLISPRIYTCAVLPTSPNEDELLRIAHFYDGDGVSAIRNKAIVLLLIEYGMRSGEVAGLKLGDIDWERDILYLHREKGCQRQQILVLKPNVGNAILRYITEVRPNERGYRELFLKMKCPCEPVSTKEIYHVTANAFKGLDIHIEHIGPHSLRRAFATIRVNKGQTFKDIADILGHKHLDTTRIYAKVNIVKLRQVSDVNWEGIL